MTLASIMIVLGTVSMPFSSDAQRKSYVHTLCREAHDEISIPAAAVRESQAVCMLTFGDMQYAGSPLRTCADAIATLRPSDPASALAVCERARQFTRDWSRGRF